MTEVTYQQLTARQRHQYLSVIKQVQEEIAKAKPGQKEHLFIKGPSYMGRLVDTDVLTVVIKEFHPEGWEIDWDTYSDEKRYLSLRPVSGGEV